MRNVETKTEMRETISVCISRYPTGTAVTPRCSLLAKGLMVNFKHSGSHSTPDDWMSGQGEEGPKWQLTVFISRARFIGENDTVVKWHDTFAWFIGSFLRTLDFELLKESLNY